MVAAVASRNRQLAAGPRAQHPPAKKPKLSQPPRDTRQNGLATLIPGKSDAKPFLAVKPNAIKDTRKDRVDEARAVVAAGGSGNGDVEMEGPGREVVTISSDDEEESDYGSSDDEDNVEDDAGLEKEQDEPSTEDTVMAEGSVHGEEGHTETAAEPEEPSFGELLQANAPDIVDVEATFVDPNAHTKALAPASSNRALSLPSATSLGTVLTQALKTNDRELLESCFGMNDLESVRSTIERLPSPLVANLLQKLAERLHKRPGRAGNLMVWVQWSLVAHGGYLASQPKVVRQLSNLNKVLKERASGLQPLLSLKGRLDMLYAQLELRRNVQKAAAMEDDDGEAVIYVEGEEESSSDERATKNHQRTINTGSKQNKTNQRRPADLQDMEESESSEDDEMPTTVNGIDHVEESDINESEDSEGMYDEEAEETENDTGDDLSEPDSDVELDDGEEISESEDAQPTKRSMTARSGLSRR
ncbi:NUC189-domain-containing protein [Glonium stellatum]|uniref:NUC189-domain-containing protein n=1 Tax=Glonium stellatum TaxID=574774 RepID=A0A8E2JSH2_9PEZI|nr:NUC189-domain-containing protein [Glonium stellatum]